MNRNLDMVYTFRRWLSRHPDSGAAEKRDDAALRVPLISRFVATHYTYEALIVAQAKRNPLSIRQQRIQDQMDDLVAKPKRTDAESARLEDLKDALALLSGLEANNVREMEKRLRLVDQCIDNKSPLDAGGLRSRGRVFSAERLYNNQKVTDLVSKAETEQNDYRRLHAINTFFSPEKQYEFHYYTFHWASPHRTIERWTLVISVYTYSTGMLVGSSLIMLGLLQYVLKQQLRMRGK
jgi:hypothetical protein